MYIVSLKALNRPPDVVKRIFDCVLLLYIIDKVTYRLQCALRWQL